MFTFKLMHIIAYIFKREDLRSVAFYKLLDSENMKSKFIEGQYCSNLSGNFNNIEDIKALCSNYITYLINQAQIWEIVNDYIFDRKILTYWIFEKLFRTHGMDRNKCNDAFAKIQVMWSDVYDHKIHANSCDRLCTYLNGITDAYEYFKGRCNRSNDSICPVSGITYKNYDPQILLEKALCPPYNQKTHKDLSLPESEELIHSGGKKFHDNALSKNGSSEHHELSSVETKPLRTFVNTILGLFLTSMLFGVLYKVNENYNNLYKFYKYHNRSLLHIYICYKLIYCTCTLLSLNLQVHIHRQTVSK
ncbi:variable surface protein [Plasmodium gonderi]|uniref:Variable surface protein n=1 Tax=Plasmodium gonderi TaxID=77519 RepID=A0A1Y1JLD3_PLAGO|nr:variable surface protein [Plasmodium gonderi]GAW82027.1 variable surface protein [Plasmodium gonderi]